MAAFNANDPRFQREMMRAASKRSMGGPVRGVAAAVDDRIVARHAGYQLGKQQEFQRLGLASKLAQQRHQQFMRSADLRDKGMDLDRDRFSASKDSFKQMMGDERRAMNIGIATGLLGTAYATYEGRRRENALESELAERQKDRDIWRTAMRGNQSFRRGRTDESALMADRYLRRY